MKNGFLLIIYFLLILEGKTEKNGYNYNGYSATSTNTNLSGQSLTSSTSDQSVVYITTSGITIQNSYLQKTGRGSSNTENSEFYGVNSAVLVQGGGVSITESEITTSSKGANAVCATNSGTVTISGTIITSTGSDSARGLHATYGGTIIATNVDISSSGNSCAALATNKGEGIVTCKDCDLRTSGAGSPLIYSTGTITVTYTEGIASRAQCVVVEGKNTVNVENESVLQCSGDGNRNNVDKCGIFLYQSMSGDAGVGTATFKCSNSDIEIVTTSSVYKTAPMFFITNTKAAINLQDCDFD